MVLLPRAHSEDSSHAFLSWRPALLAWTPGTRRYTSPQHSQTQGLLYASALSMLPQLSVVACEAAAFRLQSRESGSGHFASYSPYWTKKWSWIS